MKAKITARRAALLKQLEHDLELCPDVRAALDAALVDEPPLAPKEGGIIKPGWLVCCGTVRENSPKYFGDEILNPLPAKALGISPRAHAVEKPNMPRVEFGPGGAGEDQADAAPLSVQVGVPALAG